ncbi:MAG: FAD-dependent oxidoreductase, partial [Caldilineaceae bacterium]|nr:FAD-dependent oxidoreductase [Caldilineaceae bacterium]
NPNAGFGESGRVVEALLAKAQRRGIALHAGAQVTKLLADGTRITGVETASGERFNGGHVVVAAGAWTQVLVPELAASMVATGHPVFHLKPANPELFAPPNFVVFTADVANTGWYGFPLHPRAGVVKIANHGVGVRLHPEHDPRVVTAQDEADLRAFLAQTFPALVEAPIVYTRRCLYCDTVDEHFWIDRHPTLAGLTVSAGGSGHGFKFAPLLGALAADAVEGKPNPWLPKFRWRGPSDMTSGQEAARFHG